MNIEKMKKAKKWIKIEPLTKGWSKDIKYYIEDIYNQKFILRISDSSFYNKKLEQFKLLEKVHKLNIKMQTPLEFGRLDDGRVYMLLSWLDGQDAEIILPTLEENQQYVLGKEAGKLLKRLHEIPVTTNITWKETYQSKIPRKINMAKNASIKHKHLDEFIKYVEDHMHIIEDNPMKFQHGDFHIGNMIITKNMDIGIIDFDRMDIADPIDDFKPFVWTVSKSSVFETGLIDGYYDNHVPETFFKVLALYAAESCIGHIPWAITFGDEEVRIAMEVADKVYEWYKGFSVIIPTWYNETLKIKYNN